MNKLILVLGLFSGVAYAHKVTVETNDPAVQSLKDNGQEALTADLVHYCDAVTKPLAECLDELRQRNALEFAAECAQGFDTLPADPKIMHMAGNPGCDNGYWHNEYVSYKDLGTHKHTWSEAARDAAGREMGTVYVQQLKQNWEDSSSTAGTGSSTSGHGTATAETKGIADIIVKAGGEFSLERKKDDSTSTTTKGPSQGQINAVYKHGYTTGYNNPHLSSFNPDVFCKQGEKLCGSPQGLVPDPDATPQPKNEPVTPTDEPTHCDSPTPEPPQSKKPDNMPDLSLPMSPTVSITEDDAAYIDDIAVANIAPGNIGDANPLEECVAELRKQELQKGFESMAEEAKQPLKQRAEEALARGNCLEEWYGPTFCQEFYAKLYSTIEPIEPEPIFDEIPGWIDYAQPEDVPDYKNNW